jgi:hypothetical protein
MADSLVHVQKYMAFLYPVHDDDVNMLDCVQDVVLEHRDLTQTKGKRGMVGQANDIFGNKPSSRDICHHYHKPYKDHNNMEYRGAIARPGSEVLTDDSEEVEDDRGELGHEGGGS